MRESIDGTTTPGGADRDNAPARILRAAERLFAERGLDNVSLREIGAAAGQRNNSAVQYHFGSRAELVRALYQERLLPLNARRLQLIDALGDDTHDLRDLVRVYVQPLAEQVRDAPTGSCYARFVHRFTLGGHPIDPPLDDTLVSGVREVTALWAAQLTRLPPPVRGERVRHVQLLVTASLADAERRLEEGCDLPLPFGALVANLVDAAHGVLSAPYHPGP